MKYSLLLVENNEDDVFAFERSLAKAGLHVPLHIVSDGERAIAYLAAYAGYATANLASPLVIVLDLKLPRRDGLEVLRWLRAHAVLADTPVIVLSGSSEPRDVLRATGLGIVGYLGKPPHPDDIRRLLQSIDAPRAATTETATAGSRP